MEDFENYSLLLSTIAQRMLGNRGEMENIVQEAYLRYATASVPEIGSLKAYLMTIVTRLCLDQRKSARLQQEQPLGLRWSPPVVPADIEETVLQWLDQREAISQALLLLLECLTPTSARSSFSMTCLPIPMRKSPGLSESGLPLAASLPTVPKHD